MRLRTLLFIALAGTWANAAFAQQQPSIIVADATSGRILIEQGITVKRPVASLTKMATAAVVLDWAAATQTDFGTIAVVPNAVSILPGPNPLGLQPGDQITLRDCLYSALLGSDNFAALTLADHVGRQLLVARGKRGVAISAFVAEMNALAQAIGMRQTRFVNPHGLDLQRKRGVSTAQDMAILAARQFRDSGFVFYAKQKQRKVSYLRDGQKLEFVVKNTNKLVGVESIIAGKTGQTRAAGPCLAVGAQKPGVPIDLPDGKKGVVTRFLVSVVLGHPDRFGQTSAVVRQGWTEHEKWQAAGFPTNQPGEKYLPRPQVR